MHRHWPYWANLMRSENQIKNSKSDPGWRAANPFDLSNNGAYRTWRSAKLAAYPASMSGQVVEIDDLANPSAAERAALSCMCRKSNMAIYASRFIPANSERMRNDLQTFAKTLGLIRTEGHRSAANDGIVAIEIASDGPRKGYIPYTDRPLSWHTDGYYNAPKDRIGAFLLHCVRDATQGGENAFLDPEIAYIRMRDENPDFIAAFMHHEAMTIPANEEDNGKVRAESVGPVFWVSAQTGTLQMRYTARGRNIIWRNTPATQAAVKFLSNLLINGDPLIFRHKLVPGQGLICNNVLHMRTGFENAPELTENSERLIYRVRYLDRISGVRSAHHHEEDYGSTE